MVHIEPTEQIVTDWMTHSDDDVDNLNDNLNELNEFPSSAPEVFIDDRLEVIETTSATSTNTTSQNLTESNSKKRKTPSLSSGDFIFAYFLSNLKLLKFFFIIFQLYLLIFKIINVIVKSNKLSVPHCFCRLEPRPATADENGNKNKYKLRL